MKLIPNVLRFTTFNSNCTMCAQRSPIRNFAFLDIETTGLPYLENNKTKITELSISVVDSDHLLLGVFPRVRNKLNLCLNPCKFISPESTSITGLSNDLLENQSPFSSEIVNNINTFLSLYKKPICFVAHNGDRFDFPILRAEINKTDVELLEKILCIDSLVCFRDLHKMQILSESSSKGELSNAEDESESPIIKKPKICRELPQGSTDQMLCAALEEYEESVKKLETQRKNETTPIKQIKSLNFNSIQRCSSANQRQRVSFKLEDIYKRLTSKNLEHAHQAEGDVDCLIHCAAKYGENFIEWANNNAKLFTDILPMRPDRYL